MEKEILAAVRRVCRGSGKLFFGEVANADTVLLVKSDELPEDLRKKLEETSQN